jgi:hypothetical protein
MPGGHDCRTRKLETVPSKWPVLNCEWPHSAGTQGRDMSKLLDRMRDAIFANPVAWFFFLLAAVAEYGNYQRGHELTQVCEILPLPGVTLFSPKTAKEKAERICLDRLSDDD